MIDYQKRDMTSEEIGVKHGVSPATLTVWAKSESIPLRNRGRKKQDRPTPRQLEIIKLASIYTYSQVGERFGGMSKQSIHRIVKRWRRWMQPKQAPFVPGDMLVWNGKKFTVVEANVREGTLEDARGKRYRNFMWNGGGRIPRKIGVNSRYVVAPSKAG